MIALAAGAAWAFADGHDTTALPPAPPLQVPERGASSVAKPAGALTAIAHCESRGDPTAVSADGAHRGKYQFDATTWQSVGGSGDPALAPEHEQDRRAVALAARRGTAPWPVCGSAAGGH